MPESKRDDDPPVPGEVRSSGKPQRHVEVLEEEEKVLAGRPDANIPALLTKDVLGG